MAARRTLTRAQIIKAIAKHDDVFRQYAVARLGLFGSYARKQQTKASDVDFLVEFTRPTFDNFMGLSRYLEKLLRKKVDLITNGSLSPYIKPYVDKEVVWHEVT